MATGGLLSPAGKAVEGSPGGGVALKVDVVGMLVASGVPGSCGAVSMTCTQQLKLSVCLWCPAVQQACG